MKLQSSKVDSVRKPLLGRGWLDLRALVLFLWWSLRLTHLILWPEPNNLPFVFWDSAGAVKQDFLNVENKRVMKPESTFKSGAQFVRYSLLLSRLWSLKGMPSYLFYSLLPYDECHISHVWQYLALIWAPADMSIIVGSL